MTLPSGAASGLSGGGDGATVALDLPVFDEFTVALREILDSAEKPGPRHHAYRVPIDGARGVGRREIVAGGKEAYAFHEDDLGQEPRRSDVVLYGLAQPRHERFGRIIVPAVEPQRECLAVNDLVRRERAAFGGGAPFGAGCKLHRGLRRVQRDDRKRVVAAEERSQGRRDDFDEPFGPRRLHTGDVAERPGGHHAFHAPADARDERVRLADDLFRRVVVHDEAVVLHEDGKRLAPLALPVLLERAVKGLREHETGVDVGEPEDLRAKELTDKRLAVTGAREHIAPRRMAVDDEAGRDDGVQDAFDRRAQALVRLDAGRVDGRLELLLARWRGRRRGAA